MSETKYKTQKKISNDSDNSNNKVKVENKPAVEDTKPNYCLYLLFAVLCIIPFIVRITTYNTHLSQYPWFSNSGYQYDFFLFYKQWAFIIVAAFMAIIIIFKLYISRKSIKFSAIFIPLGLYAILALLSAIFSKYPYFSFHGSFELFESVFVLMGYCIVVYYAFLFLNTERDFHMVYHYLIILALFMSLLGFFQYIGYDFFETKLGYNLIIPTVYRGIGINMNFGAHRVYMTLYNPNYVGVFASLLIPVLFVMTLFQRKLLWSILSILSIVGLALCVVGADSLTGVIGLGFAAACIIIFMWRYLVKRFYITIPIVIILIFGVLYLNHISNNYFYNKIMMALETKKTEFALSQLNTENSKVSLVYNGNIMNVIFIFNNDNTASIAAYDGANNIIGNTFDANTGIYTVTDERFPGFTFGFDKNNDGVFYIKEEGRVWKFTNLTGDGTYYYINRFNKLDKIITAPSALLTGYERFASGRGFIWSRSLPLLKKHLILGSGPDTFTLEFPQQDYLDLIQNGFGDSVMTKPHDLYIQMGVQTGVLSLIAFLLFYLLYFISSLRLYIRGRFKNFYAKFGLAIFVSTLAYMITGLTSDSNICTAPIFWTMMGVGIALNYKARPLILEELADIKEKKEEFRKLKKQLRKSI
jgi:hypothetical protein